MSTPSTNIEIEIPSPEDGGDGIDLVAYFSGFIWNEIGEFDGELLPALNLDVDDERATVYELEIEDVEVSEIGVKIHYNYAYSAYYGCSDIDHVGDESGTATGITFGNKWVFPRHIRAERMPPDMEGQDDY